MDNEQVDRQAWIDKYGNADAALDAALAEIDRLRQAYAVVVRFGEDTSLDHLFGEVTQ